MTEVPPVNGQPVDPNTDRYPNIYDVLAAVAADIETEDPHVERIEVTCLANGESTYRFWLPRAEESEGNVLSEI